MWEKIKGKKIRNSFLLFLLIKLCFNYMNLEFMGWIYCAFVDYIYIICLIRIFNKIGKMNFLKKTLLLIMSIVIIIITIFWGIIQTTLVASEYIHMVEKNGKRYYIDKSLYGSSKYIDYYEYKNIFFRSFESDFCEFVAE